MQHDWVKSTLGHGETMCSRCKVTNREAAAIGMTECDVPPPAPTAANEDDADHLDDCVFDEDDDDDSDDMSCGELPEGGCSLAGTEWCDWKCPHSEAMLKRLTGDEVDGDHTFDDGTNG